MTTENRTIEQLIRDRARLDQAIKKATIQARRKSQMAHLKEIKRAGLEDVDTAQLRAILGAGKAAMVSNDQAVEQQP